MFCGAGHGYESTGGRTVITDILDRLSGRKTQREIMELQATMAFDPARLEMNWKHKQRTKKLIFDNVMASVEAEATS